MESFVKSRFNILFVSAFLSTLSTNFVSAEITSVDDFVSVSNISNAYLKSFGFNDEDEPRAPIQIARERQKKIDYSTVKPPVMDNIVIRKTIFDILNGSPLVKNSIAKNSKVLNKFAWNDLKLFCGTTSDLQYNLVSRLNNTKTILGECALAVLLATPTDNIIELMNRQDVIKSCMESEVTEKNIKYHLGLFKKIEQSFISFWSKTDPIYNKAYNDFLIDKFYFKNKKYNTKTLLLEGYKRIVSDLFLLNPILLPIIFPIFTSGSKGLAVYSSGVLKQMPLINVINACFCGEPINGGLLLVESVYSIFLLASTYFSLNTFKENKNLLNNIALRLNDVKTFLYVITKIENEISSNADLNEAFGDKLDSIRKIISLSNTGKTEFGRFLKTLKSLSLYDMNYFFNNTGKLLACFQIFINNKQLLGDAIYELGQVDAFLSMAVLIKKSTKYNENHTYNFTKFLNKEMSKHTPYLKAKDMWNPFLNSRVAIGNDVEFGENSSTNLKTMILTGPNAGGKSTYIVGLEIGILLSQVFGIAPADEFILTPFSKINSYIEVRDDIAAGKSLFMTEVDRVQNHIDILDALQPEEYSFTIFDEPFRGTNPYEGAAVEYSVLEALSKYKNSLTIVATHYPMIMLLEEKKFKRGFRNYKVFISRDPQNNDIIYHFKIVPGRATQSIAIDILEKYGYDSELLQRAKDIINNPKNTK
ncbi:MAG: hypothetical protein LBD32_02920 [Cytophagales bacterium]|jgi:hypothetical protein|nr:hypothetical protein [Cytophagales bacterium]